MLVINPIPCLFVMANILGCTSLGSRETSDLPSSSAAAVNPLEPKIEYPREDNAEATQLLLMTSHLPPTSELEDCRQEMRSIALQATNEDALLSLRNDFLAHVLERAVVYHWCLYRQVHELELWLADNDRTARDKAAEFLLHMRGLWVLSSALDVVVSPEERRYFTYLRKRYLDLSQRYFGNDLTVYGPSLDERTPMATPSKDPKVLKEDQDKGTTHGP